MGISEFWDAFLLFKFSISFCVSSIETFLKQKFICAFFRSWIARILGWFLCFRIALIVRFSVYWRTMFTVFRIHQVFNYISKEIIQSLQFPVQFWQFHHFQSYAFCLLLQSYRKMNVLLFSKRVYHPLSSFRLSFHNTCFWIFVAEIRNNFFVLYICLYFLHFCFFSGICYEVWI